VEEWRFLLSVVVFLFSKLDASANVLTWSYFSPYIVTLQYQAERVEGFVTRPQPTLEADASDFIDQGMKVDFFDLSSTLPRWYISMNNNSNNNKTENISSITYTHIFFGCFVFIHTNK
jgi:hypothetical protein